jgi:hypothetical protein
MQPAANRQRKAAVLTSARRGAKAGCENVTFIGIFFAKFEN